MDRVAATNKHQSNQLDVKGKATEMDKEENGRGKSRKIRNGQRDRVTIKIGLVRLLVWPRPPVRGSLGTSRVTTRLTREIGGVGFVNTFFD